MWSPTRSGGLWRFILTGGEAERGPKPIQNMLLAASNTQSPAQA
jgi:hypothetical protein